MYLDSGALGRFLLHCFWHFARRVLIVVGEAVAGILESSPVPREEFKISSLTLWLHCLMMFCLKLRPRRIWYSYRDKLYSMEILARTNCLLTKAKPVAAQQLVQFIFMTGILLLDS